MPCGCPLDQVYVPESIRQRVVEEAYTSLVSSHPGVARTLAILAQKYWWPKMNSLIKTVGQSCSICVTTESPSCPPVSKLRPLTIPKRHGHT